MQQFAAYALVALAALYAAWKLMPRALRVRAAQALTGWARRRGRLSEREAAALQRRLTASGCGDCESCGTCRPAAAPDAAAVPIVPGRSGGKPLPR